MKELANKRGVMVVSCPYCRIPAKLVDDSAIYGRSYGKKFWLCGTCGAYVGCHKAGSGDKPLGRLANPELRKLKIRGHELFDAFWRAAVLHRGWSKGKARNTAYKWLAKEMNIDPSLCHFGMMGPDRCSRAIRILEAHHAQIANKREE
jgi:zinc-finger-containing domain